MTTTRTLSVELLTRVEGEGSLHIVLRGDVAESVELRIFEPPRFFEGFLRGRSALETPDITARICGICPVAYQMSACGAVEDALGITVSDEVRSLRRLLYAGEWLESHLLHIFFLHAPDFLGYSDALAMAGDHPERVRAALRMKKAGNALVTAVGGREIHPINVKVGGFFRAPEREAVRSLAPELAWLRDEMASCIDWLASFEYPSLSTDHELVALRHETDYPFCEGRVVSSRGLDIAVAEYEDVFEEQQVSRSTALHSVIRERGGYVCGPLARLSLNQDHLRPAARDALKRSGLNLPCDNPFRSILARAVEVIQAADEAAALCARYEPPAACAVAVPLAAGVGRAATEAPRGLLFHRYELDESGSLKSAKIVPPTSQNQKSIEDDLRVLAPELARLPEAEARVLAEHAIRNYDPCISCSTHFLELRIERQ